MTQNQPKTNIQIAEIGLAIPHEMGMKMVKDYNDMRAEESTPCYTIGRKIIDEILAQPGCAGLRLYNAINAEGEKTLVYAGVDEKGKTMLELSVINEKGKLGKVEALLGDFTSGGEGPNSWFA